jgi:hypothetical protein
MTSASNNVLSAYSAVNPRPVLSGSVAGGNLWLSWPTNAGPYTLFTATNLNDSSPWLPATNTLVLANGKWQVQIPTGPFENQFYRLQQ